jgi:hypothetical protein
MRRTGSEIGRFQTQQRQMILIIEPEATGELAAKKKRAIPLKSSWCEKRNQFFTADYRYLNRFKESVKD